MRLGGAPFKVLVVWKSDGSIVAVWFNRAVPLVQTLPEWPWMQFSKTVKRLHTFRVGGGESPKRKSQEKLGILWVKPEKTDDLKKNT